MANNPPTGLETMSSALHLAHNYHRWCFEWIRPFMRGDVLDLGSGTGNHLRWIQCDSLTSIDVSEECVAALKHTFGNNPTWKFLCADFTWPEMKDVLPDQSFDVVLSCNTFEHLPDDRHAFQLAAQVLRPGGVIVLVLPAHEWLYGCMDRLAGHYRRYNRSGISEKLAQSGFSTLELRFVNAFGGLAWLINNRVLKHRSLSSAPINTQIKLFDRFLVPILRSIEGHLRLPFGQTLVCVGKKFAT